MIGCCGFFEYNNILGNNVQRKNTDLSFHLFICREPQYLHRNRRGFKRFLCHFVMLEIWAETRAGLHVQFSLFLSDLDRNCSVSRNIQETPEYPGSWK
jgi:hypothetical protein